MSQSLGVVLKALRLSGAAVGCAIVAACATIVTTTDPISPVPLDMRRSGVYHLPRTVLNVKTYTDSTTKQTLLVLSSVAEADPAARLAFQIEESLFAHDIIEVQTTTAGLLSKVTSNSTDKTGDILTNLAKIVFTMGTGGAALPARMLPGDAAPLGPTHFVASYDPLDPIEASNVRRGLRGSGFCILVGEETMGPVDPTCEGDASLVPPSPYIAAYAREVPGIYYRRPTPVPIHVYKVEGKPRRWRPVFIGNEPMFEKQSLYHVKVDRGPFIQKQITLDFESGNLKIIRVDKESEILGLTNAAVEVARIIFSIPLSGLQQDKAKVAAETALLEERAKLAKAQREALQLEVQEASQPGRILLSPNYSARLGRLSLSDDPDLAPRGTTDPLIANCLRQTGLSAAECRARIARESQ